MFPSLRVPHKLLLIVCIMLAALVAAGGVGWTALQEAQASAAILNRAAMAFALLVAVGGVAGGLLAHSIHRATALPIRGAAAALRRVADGDLSAEVPVFGRGEISKLLRALSDMTGNMRAVLGDVSASAHHVADTSAQIAQGNLDLSQRTEEQASTLEETSSSLEQLTATVAQNAEHARKAADLAIGASAVARRGGEVVGDVVSTMTDISTASRKIADIIGVIDGIAFQTNILALNAAVEAARAGEQGRGFAVVAAEVRSLAQRSAAASREIKALIGDSTEKVEAGTKLVDAAGRTMGEIVASVERVTELVGEIAAASQEQSSGIGQVNAAVTQMDRVVQQNASLVEEAAAATESMKEQAVALLRLVARFQLGQAPQPAAVRTPPKRPIQPAMRAPLQVRPPPARLAVRASRLAPAQAVAGGQWKEF
jgi:methyl-accepting chemotaxis protein